MIGAAGYAVVDVETTGLSAGGGDRVVEVAVVQLDRSGTVTGEWCTLVNPVRDLGPQHVHRIRAADVWDAPSFADVAGALAEQLAGRVLVAHNLRFDARFLGAEFRRTGVELPVPGLCTMRLAERYLPHARGRSLRACCDAAGVPLLDAHSALHDAHAAAGLFSSYLRAAGRPEPWLDLLDEAATTSWPRPVPTGARLVRRGEGAPPPPLPSAAGPLAPGDLVVFTGQTVAPRDVWVDRALSAGLRVNRGYVTRATRLLVAADPYSLSSKARRARAYDVPIVDEEGFAAMITQLTPASGASHV
ncbi:exonuclease domain-containing protein [Umezawaea beigongshangensis]|uniref:exonuclease domain-containing protein n=1 Tax=Umezawaea beigongshangensis TaxID=2780383 RepID=UPI0018F15747|nr:exonuclease domain-containing protein [Umezawaea beigongshangensis]